MGGTTAKDDGIYAGSGPSIDIVGSIDLKEEPHRRTRSCPNGLCCTVLTRCVSIVALCALSNVVAWSAFALCPL